MDQEEILADTIRLLSDTAMPVKQIVSEMSRKAGLGLQDFRTVFWEYTGETAMNYRQSLKKEIISQKIEINSLEEQEAQNRTIETCKELLVQTNLPLEEIAKRTGLRNRLYFGNFFGKCERISPLEYRENSQQAAIQKAMNLIGDKEIIINPKNIPEILGYTDPGHFHDIFEKLTGRTFQNYQEKIKQVKNIETFPPLILSTIFSLANNQNTCHELNKNYGRPFASYFKTKTGAPLDEYCEKKLKIYGDTRLRENHIPAIPENILSMLKQFKTVSYRKSISIEKKFSEHFNMNINNLQSQFRKYTNTSLNEYWDIFLKDFTR